MNDSFVLQMRHIYTSLPPNNWNDFKIVHGITGREACELASSDEAFYNLLVGDADKVYIRAKRIKVAVDK